MDKISVVIKRDTGAIEITPELVERALNFYFGADASVTVFYAVEQSAHPTPCPECGKVFSHYTGCSRGVEIGAIRRG